ncbi:hypothetical protein J3R30DRAFT_2101089 [Lentinula aciculospora]|uniref:Uncharacterized protein n=1 Tax=Lentinula aciculospora TaxID=153920 RepID=A0A9W9AHG3_9AGAR|nr:hypothetical protein J3R30DRAFT_2101089 [Lentinula aciculospora]
MSTVMLITSGFFLLLWSYFITALHGCNQNIGFHFRMRADMNGLRQYSLSTEMIRRSVKSTLDSNGGVGQYRG